MNVHLIAFMVAGVVLGVVVWLLAQLGRALIRIAEVLAAAAVVGLGVWLALKAVVWAFRQAVTHWRTSLAVLAVVGWWQCWGWPSLALTAGVLALVLVMWGRAGGCGPGGCAGRCMHPGCPRGCTPAG
jgi:DNA segregation ATPase FtsK/SpoIIIE, S-DNA-T family